MDHGPVVVRRRLGSALKALRGRRGLHLDAVARQLEISPSKLSRLETGQVEPKIRDVRDLLGIYEAGPDVRVQIMRWVDEAKAPGWWQPFSINVPADLDMYISLETEARSAQVFSLPVSGLLQTESYARSIINGAVPDLSSTELDKLVEIRVGRQKVIELDRDAASPLELHAILDEGALCRGPVKDVLDAQLARLLTRAQQSNITIQVLPFRAEHTACCSTFSIFDPRMDTDMSVVNVESTGLDAYFDTPNELSKYRSIWNGVRQRCLSPEESVRLIEDRMTK